MRSLVSLAALSVTLCLLVSPLATRRPAVSPAPGLADLTEGRLKKLPVGLARKFAAMAAFSVVTIR